MRTALARVCEACRCWPCTCPREVVPSPYIEPTFRVESCACGGSIVVYEPTDANVLQAVGAHNGTPAHLLWRRWTWPITRSIDAPARYNGRVGSSDESNRIATVARVSATTRDAGDVASIEVVAR